VCRVESSYFVKKKESREKKKKKGKRKGRSGYDMQRPLKEKARSSMERKKKCRRKKFRSVQVEVFTAPVHKRAKHHVPLSKLHFC
jgi:hypothetical protein